MTTEQEQIQELKEKLAELEENAKPKDPRKIRAWEIVPAQVDLFTAYLADRGKTAAELTQIIRHGLKPIYADEETKPNRKNRRATGSTRGKSKVAKKRRAADKAAAKTKRDAKKAAAQSAKGNGATPPKPAPKPATELPASAR